MLSRGREAKGRPLLDRQGREDLADVCSRSRHLERKSLDHAESGQKRPDFLSPGAPVVLVSSASSNSSAVVALVVIVVLGGCGIADFCACNWLHEFLRKLCRIGTLVCMFKLLSYRLPCRGCWGGILFVMYAAFQCSQGLWILMISWTRK